MIPLLANIHISPLALASLLLFAAALVPTLRPHWPLWIRLLSRVLAFVALTLLAERIVGSPLAPHFTAGPYGQAFWERLFEAGWWLIAARMAVGLGRLFVVLENRPRETQIVSDLMAGAIYVATVLAIVNFSFEVPIRGVLATSGVIAIVLGLALQSTLSDVFSGIAVGLERPYKPGDLLWVEGNIEGHVVQLNWRSTQIATEHDNIAIVPNSIMAKSRMINRSAPTTARGETITIRLDPAAPAEKCLATLEAAVKASLLPSASPPPHVSFNGLAGDGSIFDISFAVPSTERLGAARAELFSNIHTHLRHAGIGLGVPGVAVFQQITVPTVHTILEQSDLFGVLDPAARNLLADHFRPLWLEQDQILIRQHGIPEALFLIASGAVEITIDKGAGPVLLHRLSPGQTLGAIGLITETAYEVTATAMTPVKVFRLEKADISAAIKIDPAVAAGLEMLAHRGQAALRRFATPKEEAQLARPDYFVLRLQSFLKRLER